MVEEVYLEWEGFRGLDKARDLDPVIGGIK